MLLRNSHPSTNIMAKVARKRRNYKPARTATITRRKEEEEEEQKEEE
jgi:hypothetical protein